MSNWQNKTIPERLAILQRVSKAEGLPSAAIEKDWWVTCVLKAMFMTEASASLLFKGGTSLSKGWQLIERLSEDVDLAIDHSYFGVNSTTKNQREKLRKNARKYIHEVLSSQLETNLQSLGLNGFRVENVTTKPSGEPLDSDKDPTVILVWYDSICEEQFAYIQPRVKIEISCLSMAEPSEIKMISSLINRHYPEIDDELTSQIKTVLPSRTFLEKAFLLNEEFQKDKPRSLRMSRHLYDLFKLKDTRFGNDALADRTLYDEIVRHRELYYAVKYIDYSKHSPDKIDFCPPTSVMDDWRKDYADMQESFIYGDSPSFDNLIALIRELVKRFRTIGQ